MNDTAKSLMNSKASSSGTHSRVATNAANTASIDEEFSSFFNQGDAGDYVGGFSESPLSVDPVTYDETKEEHAVVKPAGRRAFFAKVVTVVVAGCATLMLVAVTLKSLPSQAHARQAARVAEAGQNRETLSPKAPAIATPDREISAVAAVVRAELPPVVQQEPTVAEPVKTSFARSTAKNRHSNQAPSKNVASVRQASVAGSKPSVVAFPVD